MRLRFKEFYSVHPWTGRHRARGVMIVHGQGIKQKYIGSWLVDSPFFYIFRLVHGRIEFLNKLYPILKYFLLVDPVTTLDITPTLLTLFGYPIATDMDGKNISSLITYHIGEQKKHISLKSYESSKYFDKKKALDGKQQEEMRKKLKSLGYIQ